MVNLLVFILIGFGLSNAVINTDGPLYIFKRFRNFMNKFPSNIGHGYECMICFPFQVGILLSIANVFLFNNVFCTPVYYISQSFDWWYIKMFFDGALLSGTTWFINDICEYLESNSVEEEIVEDE